MLRDLEPRDVEPVTRTCLGAVTGPDGPTDEQLTILGALVHRLWQRPDLDLAALAPYTADEAAAALDDEQVRRRTRELLVLLELCRHPLTADHVARTDDYAHALDVDGPGLEMTRNLVARGTDAAWADWMRRFGAEAHGMMEPVMIELETVEPDVAAATFTEIDAQLRAAAPGTLGAHFVDFYDRNGFEIGAGSIQLFAHDMSHVIGGYDATPTGEICIGAMKLMITDSDIHWLEFLGNVAIHEAGFTPQGYESQHEPALARPGAIDDLVLAMERGRTTTRDFSNVEHLSMVDWPYEQVLEEFGVPAL